MSSSAPFEKGESLAGSITTLAAHWPGFPLGAGQHAQITQPPPKREVSIIIEAKAGNYNVVHRTAWSIQSGSYSNTVVSLSPLHLHHDGGGVVLVGAVVVGGGEVVGVGEGALGGAGVAAVHQGGGGVYGAHRVG